MAHNNTESQSMRLFRPFIPSLAMLLMASSAAGAQAVLIDKSEIRFIFPADGRQCRRPLPQVEGQRRFPAKDLAKSRASSR
jgi:hypothetical protein